MNCRPLPFGCLLIWVWTTWLLAAAAGASPVMKVIHSHADETNLLRNAAFEQGTTTPTYWSSAPNGYRVAPGEGRAGSRRWHVPPRTRNPGMAPAKR